MIVGNHFLFSTMHIYTGLNQFNGSSHTTKPSDDPKIQSKMSTPDEFVADFKMFVEASFGIAKCFAD